MPRLAAALLLSAAALGACTPPPPQATAIDAQRGHVELAQLQEGRTLLVRKCSGCHATPRPAEHLKLDWPAKLGEMSERSHLDFTERALIEKYLVVMAAN